MKKDDKEIFQKIYYSMLLGTNFIIYKKVKYLFSTTLREVVDRHTTNVKFLMYGIIGLGIAIGLFTNEYVACIFYVLAIVFNHLYFLSIRRKFPINLRQYLKPVSRKKE